jgi:hypothetical protein
VELEQRDFFIIDRMLMTLLQHNTLLATIAAHTGEHANARQHEALHQYPDVIISMLPCIFVGKMYVAESSCCASRATTVAARLCKLQMPEAAYQSLLRP